MKFNIQGGGDIILSKNDFIASGGEGSVYGRGGKCYKIYTKPSNMIPLGKIKELSYISNPNIIKPEQALLENNIPVGYSMRHVSDTHVLCQLFPKIFKQRNNLAQDNILNLIKNLQESILSIHKADVLVVDLNEMNLLVDKNFKEVFFIDVDSYQTKHYPATAIMESIKDWHVQNNKWTKESDWFSWGILAFQMLTGIHPYKGKHSSVTNLTDRMKSNISVLNPDVKVPKMIDLSTIPMTYMNWFKAVFDEGKRISPPTGPVESITICIIPISSSDLFIITEIDDPRKENEIISLMKTNIFQYSKIMQTEDRIYAQVGETVVELSILNTRNKDIVARTRTYIMPKATTLYEGIVIQNILGDWHGTIFPDSQKTYQLKLPDLKGYKIIDAKYEKRVLMIIGNKNGKYDKFVYRFEKFGRQAEVEPKLFWKSENITYSGINFTVLDTGVCACINDKEELLLFAASPSSNDIKKINDSILSSDMKLFSINNQLMFSKDNKVYKMKMKK